MKEFIHINKSTNMVGWNPEFVDECKEKNYIFEVIHKPTSSTGFIVVKSDREKDNIWYLNPNDMKYQIINNTPLDENLFEVE